MYKNINIFIAGSTDRNISEFYSEVALLLGEEINNRDYNVIFDGCNGLPYLVYSKLEDKMRSTIFYNDLYPMPKLKANIKSYNLQSNITRDFIKLSDAMIFMKGGMGTLAEISYAIDSKKNKEHDNPIVILNVNNEWDELTNLLKMYKLDHLYYITDNYLDCLNYIENYLYSKNSKFYNLYIKNSMIERKNPIIIENNNKHMKI